MTPMPGQLANMAAAMCGDHWSNMAAPIMLSAAPCGNIRTETSLPICAALTLIIALVRAWG